MPSKEEFLADKKAYYDKNLVILRNVFNTIEARFHYFDMMESSIEQVRQITGDWCKNDH